MNQPASEVENQAPGNSPSPEEQFLSSYLAVRTDLRFDRRTRTNGSVVVIEDPVRGKFFQTGAKEYQFIASLNGDRTVREVVLQLQAKLGDEAFDEESAAKICQWLINANLVIGHGMDNTRRLDQQASAISKQKLMGTLNPICFKFRLFNPNALLSRIQSYVDWVFTKWFLVVWLFVGAIALRVTYTQWEQIGAASIGILSGFRWFWLLLIWVLLKVIHEAGHGIACRKFGGEVPDAGVLILLFTPMAFVNVTSSWRFSNRWHRIIVAAAGMYIELFIAGLAVIAWSYLPEGVLGDVCFNIFFMASVTTILFNANPLMRFDGYYMLSDTVGVPNLYPKGTRWFGDRLKHVVLGTPKAKNICPAPEKLRVAVYGSMAFFWKIMISLSLVIGSSVIFHGAGIILAVMGVGLWFGLPLYKTFNQHFSSESANPVDKRRCLISGAMILALSLACFTILRGPATKSAPAIVQFKDELPLRAEADGFLREILVVNGQRVFEGDPLLRLRNLDLELEIEQLESKANEASIQTRIYRQQEENALAQAEEEKYLGLLKQLKEKQDQAEGLTVSAPIDGFVFKRGLANSIGSFIKRGDEVLNIAQEQTKEIVVSVDQSDLESIRGNQGCTLRVAFPGQSLFRSKLVRIDPRADDVPSHPSLCANVGGPLPIQSASDPDSESSVRLLYPRFTAELEVDHEIGSSLRSGQRGRAFFSTRSQSLGSYLFVATCDWFEKKLEQATQTAVF